jgi:hypothetical protein
MEVTESGIIKSETLEQTEIKRFLSLEYNILSSTMNSSERQLMTGWYPAKGLDPMLVTESGITMLCKDSHSEKANAPMRVTESGIEKLCKDLHSEKVLSSIDVTKFGIEMLCKDLHP